MPNEPAPTAKRKTPKEIAAVMGVSARSVTAWASRGKYKHRRTPGGHYRIEVDEDGWPVLDEKGKR